MPGETTRITLLVAQALERLGIPYAIGGALASSLHGVMRSTLDVDIVADIRLEHIPALIDALSEEFYIDAEMVRSAVEHKSSFNLIHYETALKVDIFICKPRLFDQMQLERRQRLIIATEPARSVYVISPEDLILAELEWYRMGGEVSKCQWEDVLGVLKVRASQLDMDCMHRWANEIGVADLLERALREAEIQ